jgi:hypothetical protein
MYIQMLTELSDYEKRQADRLLAACREKDPLTLSYLCPEEEDDIPVYTFFCQENGELLAFLQASPSDKNTWELRAATRPDARQSGCFRRLFDDMTGRLFPEQLPDFFFISDGTCPDTKGLIRHLACPKLDSEHLLSLPLPFSEPPDPNGFSAVLCRSAKTLAAVHAEVFGWDLDSSQTYLQDIMSAPDSRPLLLNHNGQAAGCGLLFLSETSAYLLGFGLIPGMRGKQLAAGALSAVCLSLPENCRRLDVQTAESNQPAFCLYQNYGFISRSRLDLYRFPGFFS